MSTSYYVSPIFDRERSTTHVFKRDVSTRPIRDGQVLGGVLVTNLNTAGSAVAQQWAIKRWGRTAEALTSPDGYTSDGGRIFRAEIWTHGRKRLAGELLFAVKQGQAE